MKLSLFINVNEPDPRLALVTSKSDPTRRPLPILSLGDTVQLSIYLVDGEGNIAAASGDGAYAPYLAIGLPAHDALADVSAFTAVSTGDKHWDCSLDLDSDELACYLRAAVRTALVLSFLTVNATTGRATWLKADCPVSDSVGAPATDASVPTIPVDYVPWPQITDLTGALVTTLDGVDDTIYPLGYTVLLSYGGLSQTFQLTNDPTAAIITDPAAAPVTIRVKTWNALTNSRYWLQI